MTLWQCMLYDSLGYSYADSRVYRTKEEAEKRAKRMTYMDDGVRCWARIRPVKACWKEDE